MFHNSCKNFLRNRSANNYIMISVLKNFRFNVRKKSVLLTYGSITSERMSSFFDGYIRRTAFINFNDCSLFSKMGYHRIIFCTSFSKSIKTISNSLFVIFPNFNKTAVDFDISMNTPRAEVNKKLGYI